MRVAETEVRPAWTRIIVDHVLSVCAAALSYTSILLILSWGAQNFILGSRPDESSFAGPHVCS